MEAKAEQVQLEGFRAIWKVIVMGLDNIWGAIVCTWDILRPGSDPSDRDDPPESQGF